MQHSDIIVIGAGVSGLASSRLAQEKGYSVTVLEKSHKPGGLIKCDRVDGHLFHRVGGHVFNTKVPEVASWFWNFFNKEEEFISATRKAGINFQNKIIGYPIENYLYQLDNTTTEKIINELLDLDKTGSKAPTEYNNFETFLKGNFGPTLFELYFKPYNHKIWKTDLSKVALPWLDGKLPMPRYRETILSNILRKEEGNMVHSNFFYPENNGSQFIADRLAEGLSIQYQTPVESITRKGDCWEVNGAYTADKIIYTVDIRQLHILLKDIDNETKEACLKVKELQSNGTSNVLCTIDSNDYSWMYLPEATIPAHRMIFTGNFSHTNTPMDGSSSCTIEFSGHTSYEDMKVAIKKLPYNPKIIDQNYEPNSYVIQQNGDREKIANVKNILSNDNFYLVGRFAEWEYHNMDKAIESAMRVNELIESKS
nr:FAD-dependent oxidoreductase [uncultured Carboxylicivirga sp.]